jgi:pimeloyl-ACP methyl ester carboxylesterase
VPARERDVPIGDRIIRVREAGDPDGFPVLYFHGTPGSRLDLVWGETKAADQAVRLVSFDRPGYGGSTPAPFGLRAVAADAGRVADALGLTTFATLGQSGGGPFAQATAVVAPDRVLRVGVASGAGPFTLVPGASDRLTEGDRAAQACLPGNPDAAARGFAAEFGPLASVLDEGDDAVMAGFEPSMSTRDREIMGDHAIRTAVIASMREGLRPGVEGAAWDNVAWVGPWDFDVADVGCPVFLWYGEEDKMAPPAHGEWLHQHLPHSVLVLRPGEGHFGIFDYFDDTLLALKSIPG